MKTVIMNVTRHISQTESHVEGTTVTIADDLADYYIGTGAARFPYLQQGGEFSTIADFPEIGEPGREYRDQSTGLKYQWNGEVYVPGDIHMNPAGTAMVHPVSGDDLLTFDAFGNIIANVNHRTGLLADLLALDGGDGEISVATDADAIVVHDGVAGQAVAFYRSNSDLVIAYDGSGISVADSTLTTIPIVAAQDAFGVLSEANDDITLPSGTYGTLSFTVSFNGGTGGTFRRVIVEHDLTGLGGWAEAYRFETTGVANARVSNSVVIESPVAGFNSHWRIRAIHDLGSALYVFQKLTIQRNFQ